MIERMSEAEIILPLSEPPEPGEVAEIAPGILWARLPLPFRLDHVNVYLIEDGQGWTLFDTGINDDRTRQAWSVLLEGSLSGRPLTRVISSHYHPDHIGLAGWLCSRFDLPLLTSQTSYLGSLTISLSPGALDAKPYRDFYSAHGMKPDTTARVTSDGHRYLKMVSPLPATFRRLVDGDTLSIGGRTFSVITGEGHAPEQIMLYSAADRLLLAADQVIAKITPNISVWAVDPSGDPLGLYLRSLEMLSSRLPEDAFVLPGHQLPFRGLHVRCAQLRDHHQQRCDLIVSACRHNALSVADLVPILFPRVLDPHQLGFAFSETHAHVNYLVHSRALRKQEEEGEIIRFETSV